ncbi:MAG: polymer-forming cytoskeletal protein [Spirochaetes bacterium]|nr:polymer-forming cytoskeletal protein [Spirochaetota bacterium]
MAKNFEDFGTFIGEKSFFSGKILTTEQLRVDGKFEGEELRVEHLIVGRNGKVKCNIIANTIIVEGIIIGNIYARTRIMLMPTAAILGDIKTPELIIQNGVILEGNCIIAPDPKHYPKEIIEKRYED